MLTREEYYKLALRERFIKLTKAEEERADELHRRSIIVDLHSHICEEQFDRQRALNSGVTAFFEAIAVISEDFDESMRRVGNSFAFARRQEGMGVAYSAEDVREAKKEGKQVILAQLEPQTIGLHLDRIDTAYGLGVRMMLLTFNSKNYVGDGCGERTDDGLSYFGLDLIDRMNKVGMVIDLSHCGDKTTLEAVGASRDPVLCNHTGARTLYSRSRRLKTDEAIKAVAEKGGIIGISAVPNQLANTKSQGIKDVLGHLDYVVRLVGVDHVGIGLDKPWGDHVAEHRIMAKQGIINPERVGMELTAEFMEGIDTPEEWPNITRGLVSRGYSDQEIEKIVGGNALRIMESVLH